MTGFSIDAGSSRVILSLSFPLCDCYGPSLLDAQPCLFGKPFLLVLATLEFGIRILKYVDDTLIFAQAKRVFIVALKIILYSFELVSGLSINYHKSSVSTVGSDISSMACILCNLAQLFFVSYSFQVSQSSSVWMSAF